MKHKSTWLLLQFLSYLGVLVCPAPGSTLSLDFDLLGDQEKVTNQFPGIAFAGAVALNSSLNDIDFPPRSGNTVLANLEDDGLGNLQATPVMQIVLQPTQIGGAVTRVRGYFTYVSDVTVEVLDLANNILALAISSSSENYGTSSNPNPNELIEINFSNIRRIRISSGDFYTLDDLEVEYNPGPLEEIPEPSAALLTAAGLGLLGVLRNRWKK